MPRVPAKAPSRCPHCGFVQDEPEHLISTYCRGCGLYYKVPEPEEGGPARPSVGASFLEHVRSRIAPRPPRSIICHRCGQRHEVSGHARTTFCPECNAAIELRDVTFSSSASRPVDTRGKLTVLSTAYLSNACSICGEALIAGRISGALFCETQLRLATTGRLICQMNAQSVIVEKEARVELAYPVKTNELLVYGHASGQFECEGRLVIAKGGSIEGRLSARSLVVERGGILLADSTIRPAPEKESGGVKEPMLVSESGLLPMPAPAY